MTRELHPAEVVKLELETRLIEEKLTAFQRDNRRNELRLDERRTYDFTGEVNNRTVRECMTRLSEWAAASDERITLWLNSPGGLVMAGLALYDYLLQLRRRGIEVDVEAYGYAASMGSILLQAGSTRRISKNAYVLIHEVQSGAIGSASDLKDEAEFCDRLWKQLSEILAERSTLTPLKIRHRAARKDWHLTADEAVKLGFADEVI